jgi:hypothetical protein
MDYSVGYSGSAAAEALARQGERIPGTNLVRGSEPDGGSPLILAFSPEG